MEVNQVYLSFCIPLLLAELMPAAIKLYEHGRDDCLGEHDRGTLRAYVERRMTSPHLTKFSTKIKQRASLSPGNLGAIVGFNHLQFYETVHK